MNGIDIKAILLSKTLWGIALMAIPTIAKIFKVDISDADASGLVNQAQQMVNDALAFGGLVLAIWGRATASKPLVKPAA